jgi:acyl-CoA synthetase (AMP-forming)/AMP-acid ligase II/acyl carrier protein
MPDISPDSLAYLQYTSGSTSAPRGVMVSHRNLIENLQMCENGWAATRESVVVNWLPHFHDMGLIGGLLVGVLTGFGSVQMPPTVFLQRPIRWLRAINLHRGTVTGAPNFAYEMCVRKTTAEERAALQLNSLRVAYCGAEPVRAQTIEDFCTAFGPVGFNRNAFRPTYGLAEATVLVTIRTKDAPYRIESLEAAAFANHIVKPSNDHELTYRNVGCGPSRFLDCTVEIVDPVTRLRATGDRIGEIWVRGPNIAQGYWEHPEATRETFGGYLADTGEGPFLRTGDLGFVKDSELFITGRLKDLIIIRGRNIYPQDIEATAEGCHPALRIGGGVAFAVERDGEERVVLVHELERESRKLETGPIAGLIRQKVAEEHAVHLETIVFLMPGGVPKTSSGKVQRRLCREKFLSGTLAEIARHSFAPQADKPSLAGRMNELPAALRSLIARELKIAEDHKELALPVNRLGLDSVMVVNVQAAVESQFAINLPSELFAEAITIEEMAERAVTAPLSPTMPPLRVIPETTVNRMEFNVMPGRTVREDLLIKEYRIWRRYIEATFDRKYHSEMLASPDHLIFLTALAHTQKILYVYLCHEWGFPYDPNAPERFKLWPTNIRVWMPKLVTQSKDMVQRCWMTELKQVADKRFLVRARTSYDSMVITGDIPVFWI